MMVGFSCVSLMPFVSHCILSILIIVNLRSDMSMTKNGEFPLAFCATSPFLSYPTLCYYYLDHILIIVVSTYLLVIRVDGILIINSDLEHVSVSLEWDRCCTVHLSYYFK